MTLLENYWHGEKRSYHHTVSMSMIYALREALSRRFEKKDWRLVMNGMN